MSKNDPPESNAGYTILERFTVNECGYVLAERPTAPEPFVTWCYRADDPTNYFWGRYFADRLSAYENYMERIDNEVKLFEDATGKTFPLPRLCLSVNPSTGDIINIQRGVSGYFPSNWSRPGERAYNRETASYANEQLGISKAQEAAMLHGSMFGWHTKLADPRYYNEDGTMKRAKKRNEPER